MRTIKFRGKFTNDEYVYGDFIQRAGFGFGKACICSWDKGTIYEVEPDSVEQLAGYDDDGKEIYEHDTVVDSDGNEYTVYIDGIADGLTDYVSLTDNIDYRAFKLKKNGD